MTVQSRRCKLSTLLQEPPSGALCKRGANWGQGRPLARESSSRLVQDWASLMTGQTLSRCTRAGTQRGRACTSGRSRPQRSVLRSDRRRAHQRRPGVQSGDERRQLGPTDGPTDGPHARMHTPQWAHDGPKQRCEAMPARWRKHPSQKSHPPESQARALSRFHRGLGHVQLRAWMSDPSPSL